MGSYPGLGRWFYSVVPPLFLSLLAVHFLQRMAKQIDVSCKNMDNIRKEAIEKYELAHPNNSASENEGADDPENDDVDLKNRKSQKQKTIKFVEEIDVDNKEKYKNE